jgi:adenine-specific DNA-methyltransferase
MKDVKEKILQSIQAFSIGNLTENALDLFKCLGYNTDMQAPLESQDYNCFKSCYIDGRPNFKEEKASVKEWKYIDLLFQLSREGISRQYGLFETKRVDVYPHGPEQYYP